MQGDFASFLEYESAILRDPFEEPAYITQMFPKQLAAFRDPEKAQYWLGTRRCGKSHGMAVKAIRTSMSKPSGESLLFSTTRGHIRTTVGNALDRLIRMYGLPLKQRTLDGRFYYQNTANGHRTWMTGCKDFSEAEKLRGDFLDLAIGDECQSFTIVPDMTKAVETVDGQSRGKYLLEYLVEDVLSPRLLDHAGDMLLGGTPGVVLRGYWYEITTGRGDKPKWPGHEWSLLDNPHLKNVRQELAARIKLFGWNESSATYQREWLGRWVEDQSALIYRYDAARNHIDLGEWPGCIERLTAAWGRGLFWVLGSDIGHNDATTFILTASRHGYPLKAVVRTWGGSEMLTTHVGAELLRCKRELEARGEQLVTVVMDPGGGGKKTADDMRRLFNVPVEPAQKADKAAGIRLCQSGLVAGHILLNAVECAPLLGEWSVLPWNEDRSNHSNNYPDDYSDGWVYAMRRHPIVEQWSKVPPTPGTPEALNAEADAHKRLAARAAEIEYSGKRGSQKRRELEQLGWSRPRRGRRL